MYKKSVEAKQNDPRSTEELIGLALVAKDEEAMWEPVGVLWYRPNPEVLTISKQLLESDDPNRRELGALILSQGGKLDHVSPDDSLALLIPLLEQEEDPDVLATIGYALGQIGDRRAIKPLIQLKQHPNADVRLGVVQGLWGQRAREAIATLIKLSRDPNSKVRDWATFGLGTMVETDTPRVLAALWERVSDEDPGVRGEALVGLARRGDPRVVDLLVQQLEQLEETVNQHIIDAAIAAGKQLGDPQLCPGLERLRQFNLTEREQNELEQAVAQCTGRISPSSPA
jgi:HEAT repeat protein